MENDSIREQLEKITSSYPEIKEVLSFLLNKAGEPDLPVDSTFLKELIDLKGIGKETANDIVRVFPIRNRLVVSIQNNKPLPFRSDIVKILLDNYSK